MSPEPTDEQILECVQYFREIAPKIVQRSFFGDDNRARIDAQIECLSTIDEFDGVDDYVAEHKIDPDADYELYRAVADCFDWRDGDFDGEYGPFEMQWDSLIQGDPS